MATKVSPSTPRSKLQQRGAGLEADRSSPSTRTMSGMFGDNSPKKRAPVSRGAELNQIQEELAKTKEQLALMEKSKANLLHDLARSKRQVEDLTARLQDVMEVSKKDRTRVEEMEHARFSTAEDWQVEVEVMKERYEAALSELEAKKQAMDSLNHELVMCVESRNEAVKLAGEAMNAAESTAKRVEDLSAELLAVREAMAFGDSETIKEIELEREVLGTQKNANGGTAPCDASGQESAALLLAAKEIELGNALLEYANAKAEIEGLRQDLVLAQKSQLQLMDLNASLEGLQLELRLSKDAEKKTGLQVRSLSLELDQVISELAHTKESESALKSEFNKANAADQQVPAQLADAKQAKEEGFVAARSAHSIFDEPNAQMRANKGSESVAPAKVSIELEETQEKLTTVALEGVMLVTFLESLKAELAENQAQLATMAMKETSARLRADTSYLELTKLREAHQREAQLSSEKATGSNAAMKSFRVEFDRQKFELAGLKERESTLMANVDTLRAELKSSQDEVTELKQQKMNAFESGSALSSELENSQNEIMGLREREMSMTYRIGTLMDELEAKHLEVSELNKRVESANDKATALTVSLDNSLTDLARFKEKESVMDSKAAALSVALASLSEQTESRLLELKEKEKGASVKALALHDELRRISLEFEKALTDAHVAREDANKLFESLQSANAERDEARWQEQIACNDAIQTRKSLDVALSKAETAKHELQNALEAVHTAEQRALEGALEAEVFQEKWQAAQNELLLVKNETKAAQEDLQAALLDLERVREERGHEKQEAQLVSQKVLALKAEVLTVKAQATAAMEETEAAKQEAGKLRDLVEKAKVSEEEAHSALKTAENRLQDALVEVESLKLCGASIVEHEEEQQPSKACCKSYTVAACSQEEFTDLNLRLRDMENRLALAVLELETSSAKAEKLSEELEAIKVEKECNEKEFLELRQLLADTEKAKLDVEVEMQRLLVDDSKQSQMAKQVIDIPVHPQVNGRSFSSHCGKEDRPQEDFVEDMMNIDLSPAKANGKDQKGEMFKLEESVLNGEVGSKELLTCPSTKEGESPECDDGSLKDEVASQDDSASLPLKKKKKNLLGRLGTLLDKKKNSPQHTP